jgi:hypothetical protein
MSNTDPTNTKIILPQAYATLAGVGYKQMSKTDPTNTKIILPQVYVTLAGVGYSVHMWP